MKPPELTTKQYAILCEARDLSNYLGIPIPEIYFRDDKEKNVRLGNALGRCYPGHWIRLQLRGNTIATLLHTLTHEFIHWKFKGVQHDCYSNEGQFSKYIKALHKRNMFFDGRGLVTKLPKHTPDKNLALEELRTRVKGFDKKIKMLETRKKKLLRKIRRMESA